MACRLTKRGRVVVCGSVHPDYRRVTQTYLAGRADTSYVEVPAGEDGAASAAALAAALAEPTAAIIVGYPSFFGALPDLAKLAELAHAQGALLVAAVSEPYALSVAESPGALGADIAVGEGQALACPPQFGGPGVGLFACRGDRNFLQQLPGRLCGETVDHRGERGFVLTLSTREQHIRRERATSNICTNQGLLALALTIRVSLIGKQGFVDVGRQCLAKAHYLKTEIEKLEGYAPAFASAPFFNEFAIQARGGSAERVLGQLEQQGIIGGYDLGRSDARHASKFLVAVTERHRREDLDRLVRALDSV